MTFSDYCDLIADSVRSSGYEAFLPSCCVVGKNLTMKVLEMELSADGEEQVAMTWVESFLQDDTTVFMACRTGKRVVSVWEFHGWNAIKRTNLKVLPPLEGTAT